MRALVLTSFDGPSATRLAEVPDPAPDDDAALVAVQAAGVGAWDLQTTQGAFAGAGGVTTFPQVLGWDFTGTVTAIGARVRDVGGGRGGTRVLAATVEHGGRLRRVDCRTRGRTGPSP